MSLDGKHGEEPVLNRDFSMGKGREVKFGHFVRVVLAPYAGINRIFHTVFSFMVGVRLIVPFHKNNTGGLKITILMKKYLLARVGLCNSEIATNFTKNLKHVAG